MHVTPALPPHDTRERSAPFRFAALGCLVLAAACGPADGGGSATAGTAAVDVVASVPAWAQEAVWYQIFVERFRNGDPTNDPSQDDLEGAWPHVRYAGWEPTPWGWDWYAQEPWAAESGDDFWLTVQKRRYGGDLAGVMEQLDYLADLGITAIYFNPINDAPSLHKYDARNYRHVDRNFGPDPVGDVAIMAAEDPADPTTWEWTSADSLFLSVVEAAHARGIRVILDYSWNHTGVEFWAWKDVLENGADSRFADWYEIESFDDPDTPEDEFEYRGWAGVRELPELKKVGRPDGETHGAIEGTLHPEVRDHVFAVTRRWLDPDGDGDPSDGIDGFRLDVAEMVPLGFWREYRAFVRSINPDAYLVGEVWWQEWPERMYDPAPWLQGDVFDAVMNYRWYRPVRSLFAQAGQNLTVTQAVDTLARAEQGFGVDHVRAQMNLTASHDSPRFATSIENPFRYKFQVNPRENAGYDIGAPSTATKRIQRLILVQQATWVGAPHVWNGDEMGMWGADDPDVRKPLLWDDRTFETERAAPPGRTRTPDPVAADDGLRESYRAALGLRHAWSDLWVYGDTHVLVEDDLNRVLVYERVANPTAASRGTSGEGVDANRRTPPDRTRSDSRAIVAFNLGDAPVDVTIPGTGTWRLVFTARDGVAAEDAPVFEADPESGIAVRLPPMRGWVLMPVASTASSGGDR